MYLIQTSKNLLFTIYKPNWFPLRYCKYAATKSPVIVTGTSPNTSPESNTSTIYFCYFFEY